MKYFYQQLLAILSASLVIIFVCSALFYNYMTNHLYDQREKQLYGYAQGILSNDIAVDDLKKIAALIGEQTVEIALFDSNGQMTYPESLLLRKTRLTSADQVKLQNGEVVSLRSTNLSLLGEEMPTLTVFYPIFKDQQYTGFLALESPISYVESELLQLRQTSMTAVVVAVGLAIVLSYVFARYQTRRIARLRLATHDIAQGNFDIVLPNRNLDEFDDLANDFNFMTQSLKDSTQEIERQENVRRQFMMDVAHEMRTPLTTMNGLLEGLLYNMIPETKRERSLNLIHKETQRLIRLVNESLDYEKIRADQISLVKHEFEMESLFQTIVEQLQEMAQGKGNQLVYDCEENMRIHADYDRFIQILVNITKNAIQFTDNGVITLRAYTDEQTAHIDIEDTGIGISEHELNAIWERFYKVDVSRKNNEYGESGIGLSIVKSLIEVHGGTIEVRSQLGKGSIFMISLPK